MLIELSRLNEIVNSINNCMTSNSLEEIEFLFDDEIVIVYSEFIEPRTLEYFIFLCLLHFVKKNKSTICSRKFFNIAKKIKVNVETLLGIILLNHKNNLKYKDLFKLFFDKKIISSLIRELRGKR